MSKFGIDYLKATESFFKKYTPITYGTLLLLDGELKTNAEFDKSIAQTKQRRAELDEIEQNLDELFEKFSSLSTE